MVKVVSMFALVILSLLVGEVPAIAQQGTVRYVNRTDPTCGGQSPCYTTIQAAVNAAGPGNIVRIQSGTYTEQVTVTNKNTAAGSTEIDRIVIESDPASAPGSVVLRSTNQGDDDDDDCEDDDEVRYGIRFRNSRFVTLRDITITGVTGQAVWLAPGSASSFNHAIHIELNRIYGNLSNTCKGAVVVSGGNRETLIVNNLIYANGLSGIAFEGSGSGPHYVINNTIYGNRRNGIDVARGQSVTIANNLINANGTASGTSGGRWGILRESSTTPNPQAIRLLNNLVCGNTQGQISAQILDATDAGNLTLLGNEGTGVAALPGCDNPANLFTNRSGPDNTPNTIDDDFSLKRGSLAIDVGMDPRTLGLNPAFNPVFEADHHQDGVRPFDGNADGNAVFDASAFEFTGDVIAPQVAIVSPNADAYVRGNVTVTAQATDNLAVTTITLSAGGQTLPTSITPGLPALSAIASGFWSTTGVSDGTASITASATDSSSNTRSTSRNVIVDNTPPDTQITSGPIGQIAQTTATFTFSGTDNLTPVGGLLFAWRIDSGAWSSFSPNTSVTINNLGGAHTFEVIARDLAGNEDPTPAARTFIVQIGPTIANVNPANGIIGTLVTITGTNFEPGTTQVAFNGVTAVIRTITATQITTTVPPTATTGLLTVTTSRGSANQNFTIPTSQDFTLQISPSSIPTVQGGAAGVLIDAIPTNDFAGLIQLASGPLPPGVTATFSRANLAPNNHVILTLRTSATTPSGAHAIEVRGTAPIDGQTATRSGSVTLNVAAPGQTILVGKVLDGNERPLAGVSIKLGGTTLTHLGSSDSAGNLFIPLNVSGPTVFLIDGSPANNATTNYPTIPITLNIQPSLINELGYVPRLLGQPVVKLTPFVPGQATVITAPDLPGFKMTIPAGVQIIGWDGQPNNQFGVTTVPIDRSPLPPLVLPPGFEARQTYLFSFGKVGGGQPTGNIPIDTPNDVGGLPGDKVDLYYFNEAPDGTAPNQWEKYGTGTVSTDGTTIVTDINPATGLPYGIPRFCCGARTNAIQRFFDFVFGGPSGGPNDGGKKAGDPVDTATGLFYVEKTDMGLAGRVPIIISRTYRTNQTNPGPFGIGTSWPPDIVLARPPSGSADAVILVSPGNRQDTLSRQSLTRFANDTSPWLRGAVLDLTTAALHFKDGSRWEFDPSGILLSQRDRHGNRIMFSRDGQGRVVRIVLFIGGGILGGELNINYTSAGIASITDAIGRQVRYSYDAQGRLETVTDPAGGVTRYTYDSAHRMLTLTDPKNITFLTNEYDSEGRVVRQTQADGGVWSFAYTSSGNYISQTVVTNPRGDASTYRFNAAGYQVSETDALGQTTTFERQAGTNLVLSITDPLKRVIRLQHDSNGNITRITDPAGNVRSFSYDPMFNKVTSATDPLGNISRFEYAGGNLIAIVDPLGNRTTFAYNSFGQLTSTTDALGNVTTFTYDPRGRLTDITDPLGNRSRRAYDAVFRITSQTDPRGKITHFTYNGLNQVTSIRDSIGGVTRFTYDDNGNLLSVTDARGSVTGYSYDSMDQVVTRIDPVGATESFQYDGMGNLTRHIDRKGQHAIFIHDPLNRRIGGQYADGTSTTFIYDSANRLVQATDSLSGTIANQYDTIDRLAAQTSSMGSVRYEYDSAGRRTRMIVPGQSPVTYSYDSASRLRQILQGPQLVDFSYDSLGRRTQLTLPNGVSTEYQYDTSSRLIGLVYRNMLGILGDLTYQYDKAGNRIGVGGSFARTLLPAPILSANYDAANRQRTFGDKTMTFDNNGNLQTMADASGTTTYIWNTRNQLTNISGPVNATFMYDELGRRRKKVINGAVTEFLYDGVNPIQETNATSVTANILTGLGIDEFLTRTDMATGSTNSFLTDALGSTLALTNASGVAQTEYTYESFGKANTIGMNNSSAYLYTGREDDGIGPLFYRKRFYEPTLHRFIAEDPIGMLGGNSNLYAYVMNMPTMASDPLGLYLSHLHPIITMAAMLSSGYDPFTAAFVAGTNVGADFFERSQDPRNANWHSMAQPKQTADEAKAATDALIRVWMEPTGNKLFDLVNLGRALHASDDRFPSGHRGFQTAQSSIPSPEHVWGDFMPRWQDLVDAVRAQREILRQYGRLRTLSKRKG